MIVLLFCQLQHNMYRVCQKWPKYQIWCRFWQSSDRNKLGIFGTPCI